VVALACQLPAATGVPLSRWTGPELAAELAAQGLAGLISATSILRILAEHPVKPWQYQSWIYPRDPHFEAKATVILDLYRGFYQGKPLRPGDRILSFVAKPSIQARGRCCPTRAAGPGRQPCHRSVHRGLFGVHVSWPFSIAAMCWAIRAASAAAPYNSPEPRDDSHG
jgi:hypothetical protein